MAKRREYDSVAPWIQEHPCSVPDEAVMSEMRTVVAPMKGKLRGVEARIPFGGIMERVSAPEGVDYAEDTVGGINGWWCRPQGVPQDRAVMHIHGGWFNWGSAFAFRHLGGHVAVHSGAAVFLPDYRLAPEHPFPAATEDIRSSYLGLYERGYSRLAVTGDSAGGNLALGLLKYLSQSTEAAGSALVGGVAISPVTDLTLSGESWATRGDADPLFTRAQVTGLVQAYLASHAADDPAASPLFADLKGLAAFRVHVGSDEVLLSDSIRFVEKAFAAGVDARLEVWDGMIHGFLGSVGRLEGSNGGLQRLGEFIRERFVR
jgi:epsilon-lactone hydrolase